MWSIMNSHNCIYGVYLLIILHRSIKTAYIYVVEYALVLQTLHSKCVDLLPFTLPSSDSAVKSN